MSQLNCTLVRRWFEEVWNQRLEGTIEELIGQESVCHGEEGPIRGPGEFKERQYAPFVEAFPDIRIEVEAMIAQDDQVVVRWVANGTQSGHGLGFRPTDQPVAFRGITWIQVRDGKLKEGWQSSNIPEVVRGLSAMSPL